jgi:hypothetical protein
MRSALNFLKFPVYRINPASAVHYAYLVPGQIIAVFEGVVEGTTDIRLIDGSTVSVMMPIADVIDQLEWS